jgi:hypothetical protein
MSARQQGGRLRAIAVRKIKEVNIKMAMASSVEAANNVSSGRLKNFLATLDDIKRIKISYKINKDFDIIYDAAISFDLRIKDQIPYAEYVDEELGEQPDGLYASVPEIEKWIRVKIKNGRWKNANGANYVVNNNYSSRLDPGVVSKGSRGGKSKTYTYPLVGHPKSKKYRTWLAIVLAKSINQNGELQNRSNYMRTGFLLVEAALYSAIEEFYEYWEQDSFDKIGSVIFSELENIVSYY